MGGFAPYRVRSAYSRPYMPKNIVVCCDGTAGEYGLRKSNVVKLYSVLARDTHQQVAFYDPGVGTATMPAALSAPLVTLRRGLGLAFGYGLTKDLHDAYRYLMQTYETGDRIFIFGFSRGAYTARALAGMLHKCGLLSPHNDNLLPYALKIYKHEPTGRVSNGFRKTFAQRVQVDFLGLWDTVSSIGWIYDPIALPYTAENPSVRVLRHALAIHERRAFYRQNQWRARPGQDVKEVWFSGSHRDVGGAFPEEESGLSQVALRWMLREACAHGLLVDRARMAAVLPKRFPKAPDDPIPEFPRGPVHEALSGLWWLAEVVPKLYRDPRDGYRRKLKIPMGRPRYIPDGATVHASVLKRATRAENLPKNVQVEPDEE